ncbi:hypothetical protein KSP40_PGU018591 [Platanthera guangdongensis]|uniref:Uncharacterized protein n=1 Tax=Platanthera guangdongensis TaxID=2320717 RepID=A0ABR2LV77_9ASPA
MFEVCYKLHFATKGFIVETQLLGSSNDSLENRPITIPKSTHIKALFGTTLAVGKVLFQPPELLLLLFGTAPHRNRFSKTRSQSCFAEAAPPPPRVQLFGENRTKVTYHENFGFIWENGCGCERNGWCNIFPLPFPANATTRRVTKCTAVTFAAFPCRAMRMKQKAPFWKSAQLRLSLFERWRSVAVRSKKVPVSSELFHSYSELHFNAAFSTDDCRKLDATTNSFSFRRIRYRHQISSSASMDACEKFSMDARSSAMDVLKLPVLPIPRPQPQLCVPACHGATP